MLLISEYCNAVVELMMEVELHLACDLGSRRAAAVMQYCRHLMYMAVAEVVA